MAETLTKPNTNSPDASGDRDKSRGRSAPAQENLQGLEKVFIPYEGFLGTSAVKEQLRRSIAQPVQTALDDLAAESSFLDALLGTSMLEPPIERHAAIMSDPRFSHPANAPTSSRIVNRLHQTYGNGHVQRVMERIPMMHLTEQSGSDMESRPVIQRWGSKTHQQLTEQAVKKSLKPFGKFSMSSGTLRALKIYSSDMDVKLPELWFNFIGLFKKGDHDALVKHYKKNVERARNHGEGGLYDMSKAKAAPINESHHRQYETRAMEEFKKLPTSFSSAKECADTKEKARLNALPVLGDALHVAQDRGSHGDGAKGWGHDNTTFDCDEPGENKPGLEEARKNTEQVTDRAAVLLWFALERALWYHHRTEVKER